MFKSPIIEHWAPLHQTPHILLISLMNSEICVTVETLGGKFKMFLELQNQRNIFWRFSLIWLLRCSFIDLSTLTTMEALRKKEMKLILPITIEDVVALGPTAEATLVYI